MQQSKKRIRIWNISNPDYWASIRGFLLVAILIVIVWILNLIVMPILYPALDGGTSNAGAAGDMFGGLTALFSGLAFAGLISTLFMQRRELEYQRNELEQTRTVFQVQRFENTFFGVLKLLNDHVNSTNVSKGDLGYHNISGTFPDETGRAAYSLISEKLPDPFKKKTTRDEFGSAVTTNEESMTLNELCDSYSSMYSKYLESILGPYYRLIYAAIRLVEGEEFSKDPKDDFDTKVGYIKILRAHLGASEIRLLLFNCASIHGEGMKPWVEKYSLLRHLSRDDLKKYNTLVAAYDKAAFDHKSRRGNPIGSAT